MADWNAWKGASPGQSYANLHIPYIMEERNILSVWGRGPHRHILYGDADFSEAGRSLGFRMRSRGILRHEKPDGTRADHRTLVVEEGHWVLGRQLPFHPFSSQGQSEELH